MTLYNSPPLLSDVLYIVSLLLVVFVSVAFTQSTRQRNYSGMMISMAMFMANYLINQIICVVMKTPESGYNSTLSMICCAIPAWCFVVALLLIMLANAVYLRQCNRWDNTHVSIKSVKESVDKLPSGLAFYMENGTCILVNEKMHELSSHLLGHDVLDGRELFDAVTGQSMRVDMNGRSYLFQRRKLAQDGEMLYELRADDMTELVAKTEQLKKGNEQLADMANRMTQLGQLIDDTIKRQEILQAKIDIHNTMNRLLLTTSIAVNGEASPEDVEKILENWKNNALLLCMDSKTTKTANLRAKLNKLADMLGISLIWEGTIPSDDSALLQLLEVLFHESMINAVKHGNDKYLKVKLWKEAERLHICCTNGWDSGRGEYVEGGGLSNLRRLVVQAGGSMEVSATEEFKLHVVL